MIARTQEDCRNSNQNVNGATHPSKAEAVTDL